MDRARSEVRAREDTISIPTYERGAEDKNPALLMKRRNPIHPGSSIIYPYPMQETLFPRKADRQWRILCLENAYLRLGVLPELGGRLLYLFDKVANEDALYHNHVIKWARIGIRGAWFSGGIEWNFPNGHTVTSSSPVDGAIRTNRDGSASLLVGDIERVSRMRWTVALTLHPERACLQVDVCLSNRTSLPNRFWFWSNSAVPLSANLQYLSSASKVYDLKEVLDFPVHAGVDISWDRNHPGPQDMFCLNPRKRFVAWYDHGRRRGLVNVADRTEARGTKFYTWGNSDDGGIWEGMLTESDGHYTEMQTGRLRNQGIWEILSPYCEERWQETWYPVRGLGAPTEANEEAALSLAPRERGARLQLGVQVTSPRRGALLTLVVDGARVWERRLDLDPASAYLTEISLKGKRYPGREAVLSLTDASGATVLTHRQKPREPQLPIAGHLRVQADRSGQEPEAQWRNGLDHEKLGAYDRAAEAYRAALRGQPLFSPAAVSLAVLLLRQGRLEEAEKSLREVLDREPSQEDARFHLGSCLLAQERPAEAAEQLKLLLRSPLYRRGAAYLLGGLWLGLGEPERAVEQLEKLAAAAGPASVGGSSEAAAFLACALRKQGRIEEAARCVEATLAADPLCLPALAESWFAARAGAGGSGADAAVGGARARDSGPRAGRGRTSGGAEEVARRRLEAGLRGEVQSWLELACEYSRSGLYGEAYELLLLYRRGVKGGGRAQPMADYHLGYLAEKLGLRDGRRHYREAAAGDPEYVFPHRLESERVLRRAIAVEPRDARARYYLGNLLCARQRPEEAMALWRRAAPALGEFSVVHRNLGRAYWKHREDPDAAIRAYRRALRADPLDYKLYYELNRILLACGLEEERGALVAGIPPSLLDNDVIAELAAAFYVDTGAFDRALQILTATHFYPWEVYKGVRILYVDALIGRGIALMGGAAAGARGRQDLEQALESFRRVLLYPRNIGVGEPFHKANAEALHRMGLALEALGRRAEARRHWEQAAREPRPEPSDLSYYKGRALQKLGRRREASGVFGELLEHARQRLTGRQASAAGDLYLAALAHKGLGNPVQARQELQVALALDRSHRRCRWEANGFGSL